METSRVATVSYLIGIAVGILLTVWCLADSGKAEQE